MFMLGSKKICNQTHLKKLNVSSEIIFEKFSTLKAQEVTKVPIFNLRTLNLTCGFGESAGH
jgi:hypothetical protein